MWLSLLCIFVAGVTNVNAATEYEIDQRFTSVAALEGQLFVIVNETDEMAFYNKDAQNLAYDTYTNAVAGAACLWKLHSLADEGDEKLENAYAIEAVKADGSSQSLWGHSALYLNSGAEGGFNGCFALGNGTQYGTDVLYGGAWEIEYDAEKGFALKNVARGGYLAGVNPAPTGEEPIYWTFCTLKEIGSTDPLAAEKEALAAAIAKGQMYNGLAYTEESFGTLEFATDAAEYLLANPESADAESLRDAANNIYNVAAALQLKEGFSNLTPEYFMTWDSPIKPATCYSFDGCAYELFTPTGVPLGDPNVGYLNFANLQGYEKLYVTYTEGTPRIMMNRDIDQGQWSAEETESHLIEFPKADAWSAKYFTNENGVVAVDLKQIVADKGFANLNTIKGANWASVTVTGLFLYKAPVVPTEATVINWDATAQGYENATEIGTVAIDENINVVFDKNTNNSAPKYYTTGTAVRAYVGNTITISGEKVAISKVEFTFGSNDGTNDILTDKGTYSEGVWTTTENTNFVKFTVDGTKGNRRIAAIQVTYTVDENAAPLPQPVHITNTSETAYTVAEAIVLTDAGEALSDTVFVKGIVSQVDKILNGAITYWISDDGTTTNQFECYKGKNIDGADFAAIEEVEVGAEVIVKGTMTKYGEIYEFRADNQLVSYKEPVKPLFADGTYYIYNNGTGKFLGAGAEWSTHAIVDNVGLDYYLSYNVGKYTIDSRVSNGYDSQYLNGEWNDANMFGWTFVDKGNGNYMISDGNQFLAAQEDGRVVMTNDTTLSYLWTLKTLEQRLAELANATPENPVDATFLIQGANFSRNDQRNYAWSMEANNWTLSGGTYENRCAETYHTTFTLAQTLYNAPAGKYLLSAQGFYRQDDGLVEELPVFYANTSTVAFPTKDGVENSMSDASESFSAGLYNIEPFVVNVSEAGALTIGARGTALSQWVIFDNFRLTYLSSEVDIDDIAADYAQVLADAKAALESEHYAMVTGIERESLAETIEAYSAVENEQHAYTDAINNLSYATSYFTNAKDAYERLIKAKEQLANCVEDYPYANPRYKEEASEYAELTAQMADDASEYADIIMSQARRIAESHALLEGVENSANLTGYISNAEAYFGVDYWELVRNSGGYIEIRSDQPLTSADYGTYSYFDGGNWSSDYWDVALQQEIYLPAGRYQVTVSSRASSDVAFTLYAGDESVAMPTIGSEGGLFGRGWNDTSLEFDMPREGYVTIGVRGESNVIYNWMSFTRFRLAKFPNAADYNKLYIADDTKLAKGNATLPISLQNEDEIVGLQFDVVLPYSDMELTGIESGFRSDSHGASFNRMNDGSYRVVMASMDNEVIEGNDGVLMNLGIKIPAYVSMGGYGFTLKNVVMTTKSLQTVKCADRTFYVNISGKMGDVNSDDMVDVTDVVMIIDNILEHYDANFNEAMADVNSDGYIDVTDVVNVIDAILGRIELSRGAELIDRSAYTAFQMDLTIPAGYVLESVSLTDIAKDSHSLAYTMLPDGRCRVVVCSMNNDALPGAWDEVISLNLRGKGDAQVNIDRAVFVTINGERHELMMNPTSIAELSTFNSQLSTRYNLQGRRVEKSAKGVLIENGRKVVIK